MWLYGFGFPRYRGGLMYWADTIGVREVYNQIAAWHQRYGERWAPSPLLRRLAEAGTPLREAKAGRADAVQLSPVIARQRSDAAISMALRLAADRDCGYAPAHNDTEGR